MNEKSLEQLAEEYTHTLHSLDRQIEQCRSDIRTARLKHQNFTVTQLNRKLSVLYDQHNEVEKIAEYLHSYYDSDVRCAV